MVRAALLGAVLLFVTGASYLHQRIPGAGKPVGVDALCPFGGIETLFSLLAGGPFLQRVAASSVVLLVGSLALALVLRRSFCGQLCPLGALQGLFGWMGSRVVRRRPRLPKGLDRPARLLKYAVLAVFAVWTWQAATLVMRPFDPWAAWAHITSAELFEEFGVGVAILGISLFGSLAYDRFFCKYLCPMGAFLALFSKVSFLRIRRDAQACIDCGRCDAACPMNVEVANVQTVTSSECISCSECVNACPAGGALEIRAPRSSWSLTPLAATGIVAATLVVTVIAGRVSGNFDFTMPSLAEAVERHQTRGTQFDPSLIKGYMSMAEIASATGIPEREFAQTFRVSDEDLRRPMKEISGTYGFSPHDVRDWVTSRLAGG